MSTPPPPPGRGSCVPDLMVEKVREEKDGSSGKTSPCFISPELYGAGPDAFEECTRREQEHVLLRARHVSPRGKVSLSPPPFPLGRGSYVPAQYCWNGYTGNREKQMRRILILRCWQDLSPIRVHHLFLCCAAGGAVSRFSIYFGGGGESSIYGHNEHERASCCGR